MLPPLALRKPCRTVESCRAEDFVTPSAEEKIAHYCAEPCPAVLGNSLSIDFSLKDALFVTSF